MMNTKKTSVLWDMDGCPIPDGFEPRLVRQRIESALTNSGFSGPLTITAIGDLRKTGDEVLRHLSSTGIALEHFNDVGLSSEVCRNKDPFNIMVIYGLSELEAYAPLIYNLANKGYPILLAHPRQDEAQEWLWKSFLRPVTKDWLWENLLKDETDSGTAHETTRLVLENKSPFSCELCDFASKSFDDFATHLKSVSHAYSEWDWMASKANLNRFENKPEPPNNDPATVEEWNALYAEDMEGRQNDYITYDTSISEEDISKIKISRPKCEMKTLVLWDINGCPIPDGFDPRLVSQRIESVLNRSDSFRPSPLTITAIGDVTRFSVQVLRELSSTGIALRHSLSPYCESEIQKYLRKWTSFNPTKATIMLITGPPLLQGLAETLYHLYDRKYYRIILVYPQRDEAAPDWLWKSFLRGVSRQWLWKSLLEGEMYSGTADDEKETTKLVLQDNNLSEMGESRWSCSLCPNDALQSFEDLAEHLKIHVNPHKKKAEEEADPE